MVGPSGRTVGLERSDHDRNGQEPRA
jgi:hypothetical protein